MATQARSGAGAGFNLVFAIPALIVISRWLHGVAEPPELTILKGVQIGGGSIVAAGWMVTCDVHAGELWAALQRSSSVVRGSLFREDPSLRRT